MFNSKQASVAGTRGAEFTILKKFFEILITFCDFVLNNFRFNFLESISVDW